MGHSSNEAGTTRSTSRRRHEIVDGIGEKASQAISRAPSQEGGTLMSVSGFASDAVTIGDRLTINAGLRFDHSRAISQDLPAPRCVGK